MVIAPDGHVRYVVSKSVLNEECLKRQRAFMASSRGRALWSSQDGHMAPVRRPFKALHPRARQAAVPGAAK